MFRYIRRALAWLALGGVLVWLALLIYALSFDPSEGQREFLGSIATPIGLAAAAAGGLWLLIRTVQAAFSPAPLDYEDPDDDDGSVGYGMWGSR